MKRFATRAWRAGTPVGVAAIVLACWWADSRIIAATTSQSASQGKDSWQIPPKAAEEHNPIAPGGKVLQRGRELFLSKCSRCHGRSGRGDGPDVDPERPAGDLTDPERAGRNPDGVMFYRVWNGRKNPDMPAFKTDMTRDEVWTVIHYVKTLRQ
jgi:mono/diheme cytochrome c family protein